MEPYRCDYWVDQTKVESSVARGSQLNSSMVWERTRFENALRGVHPISVHPKGIEGPPLEDGPLFIMTRPEYSGEETEVFTTLTNSLAEQMGVRGLDQPPSTNRNILERQQRRVLDDVLDCLCPRDPKKLSAAENFRSVLFADQGWRARQIGIDRESLHFREDLTEGVKLPDDDARFNTKTVHEVASTKKKKKKKKTEYILVTQPGVVHISHMHEMMYQHNALFRNGVANLFSRSAFTVNSGNSPLKVPFASHRFEATC